MESFNKNENPPFLLLCPLKRVLWIYRDGESTFFDTKSKEYSTTQIGNIEAQDCKNELLINGWTKGYVPDIRIIYPNGNFFEHKLTV